MKLVLLFSSIVLFLGIISPVHARSPQAVQYMYDGPAEKKRILLTVFDGAGTVTVSTSKGGSVAKHTFALTAEELAKFIRGFDEIKVLRDSKLGRETVDTETHHIFIVVDRERFGEKGASYGVLATAVTDDFRSWLSIIDRAKDTK